MGGRLGSCFARGFGECPGAHHFGREDASKVDSTLWLGVQLVQRIVNNPHLGVALTALDFSDEDEVEVASR